MADGSAASRMRALLNKFEGVKEPPPPPKDRVKSSLDAPRPELTDQAKSARVQSITRVSTDLSTAPKQRYVPRIGPGDSDEVRDLKRAIQAKEQEIMDMAGKLQSVSERLDRVVEIFTNSAVEVAAEAPPAKPEEDRVKAFQSDASSKNERKEQTTERKSASSPSPTSLEAILAAARSGQPRVKSETPKYSKLLRDMK